MQWRGITRALVAGLHTVLYKVKKKICCIVSKPLHISKQVLNIILDWLAWVHGLLARHYKIKWSSQIYKCKNNSYPDKNLIHISQICPRTWNTRTKWCDCNYRLWRFSNTAFQVTCSQQFHWQVEISLEITFNIISIYLLVAAVQVAQYTWCQCIQADKFDWFVGTSPGRRSHSHWLSLCMPGWRKLTKGGCSFVRLSAWLGSSSCSHGSSVVWSATRV